MDEQQVNLTRFNLLFPEKRTFFLEGQGIFNFGIGAGPNVNGADVPTLFFSRQIGISRDQPVPIIGGGRVTGKVGAYQIGALSIQTDDRASLGAVSTNFSAVRLRRDVLRRSAVGVLYTDRAPLAGRRRPRQHLRRRRRLQLLRHVEHQCLRGANRDARRAGGDLSYRGQFNYAGDRYGLVLERLVIEEGFNPEVGFMRRPEHAQVDRHDAGSARVRAASARIRKYLFEATGSYIENNAGAAGIAAVGRNLRPRPEQRRHAAPAGDAAVRVPGAAVRDRSRRHDPGRRLLFRQPRAPLHAGGAATVCLDTQRGARQLLRRRQDHARRQRRPVQPDQPDPGAAGDLDQPRGSAVRALHRHPGAGPRGLYADAADVRRRRCCSTTRAAGCSAPTSGGDGNTFPAASCSSSTPTSATPPRTACPS